MFNTANIGISARLPFFNASLLPFCTLLRSVFPIMPVDPDDLQSDPILPRRVLVAPLNWGLGHATRCIPIIRTLEALGVEVIIASDGASLLLLRAEFPHLKTISLPSYKIRYFSRNMVFNIARQLPRMLFAIRSEQWETERIIRKYNIQGIISDNRYGCFSKLTKNVLLTHQTNLMVPGKALEWSANRVLRMALSKFDEIWVPDSKYEPNLSGALSHPAEQIEAVRYIGLLTRTALQLPETEKEYDVAVVLSGPEPQRTLFEQILMEQAISLPYKFIFILGKTKSKEHHYAADNVEVVSYLTSEELNKVIAATDTIICRSGYSSLMDLVANGKRAILVPTPGQTEQEYLAEMLSRQKCFVVQQQENINLQLAMKQIAETRGLKSLQLPVNQFDDVLKNWLGSLDSIQN